MSLARLCFAGAGLAMAAAVASAQPVRGVDTLQGCADDAGIYCGQILPGEGRTAACLRSHSGQLSRLCRQTITDALARGQLPQVDADILTRP